MTGWSWCEPLRVVACQAVMSGGGRGGAGWRVAGPLCGEGAAHAGREGVVPWDHLLIPAVPSDGDRPFLTGPGASDWTRSSPGPSQPLAQAWGSSP